MPVNVDVGGPFYRQAERLAAFGKSAPLAKRRAIGTLARRLPVEARRDIQTEYNLKAARINQDLRVTQSEDGVTLRGIGTGISLIAFGATWRGVKTAGAVAKIFVGEAAHTYAGDFIAIGRGGNKQVFTRTHNKKTGGAGRSGRLPIRPEYGPSVAGMLRKGDRETRLGDFAQTILSAEIDRLLTK